VEVKHALDVAHYGFGGGEDQGEISGDTDCDDRENIENGECNRFGLHWIKLLCGFTIADLQLMIMKSKMKCCLKKWKNILCRI
jgi:hypothetical protein